MITSVPSLDGRKVLVVGDVMLDRYWKGSTARISPEAPVPVTRVTGTDERPGGAANVALNIAALGGKPTLVGLTGDDEAANTLETLLGKAGVECLFERSGSAPTITKLRVISRNHQLMRLDFEDAFSPESIDAMTDRVSKMIEGFDLVVCSDYAKGALAHVDRIIKAARDADRDVIIDPKGKDFSRYSGASLITPNLVEFEEVVGSFSGEADLVDRARTLREKLDLKALLITRSEQGMTLLEGDDAIHMPTRAREVFDVTGAGDTVIATLGLSLAAGQSLQDATALANLAAGCVVAKMGTATVSMAELQHELANQDGKVTGVLDEDHLLSAVTAARGRGERIVMTNGCFDLLHAGHVEYLSAAGKLGDRLIVAVNSDDSVRRLKGNGRPVNTVELRMAVLAGLESVDWVVAFSEDTPARLIENVRPDVLVKGGDYKPEEIAGYDSVNLSGGEVIVLDFKEGVSTTRILERVRATRQAEGA